MSRDIFLHMASHTTKHALQPDTCINIDVHVFMHINMTFEDDDDIMYNSWIPAEEKKTDFQH